MHLTRIIPIKELTGFNAAECCVKPGHYGTEMVHIRELSPELLDEIATAVQEIDSIAVAMVEDELGSYYVGTYTPKGWSRFVLFNAAETGRENAEIRAITFNTGRGALSRYWYDRWVKYRPGSVL